MRTVKRLNYDLNRNRVTVELTSEECAPKTQQARVTLVELLKSCIDDQNYLHCDGDLLEKMTITHDGVRWILRSEAIVLKTETL